MDVDVIKQHSVYIVVTIYIAVFEIMAGDLRLPVKCMKHPAILL